MAQQALLQSLPPLLLLQHRHHLLLHPSAVTTTSTTRTSALPRPPCFSCPPHAEPEVVIHFGSSTTATVCISTNRARSSSSVWPVRAKLGSRSALYGDCENYVLIEPGQDEVFVDLEELRVRLRGWLENWPDSSLPDDLSSFDDLDAATTYLLESACELEICDGSGVVQWFEVRL